MRAQGVRLRDDDEGQVTLQSVGVACFGGEGHGGVEPANAVDGGAGYLAGCGG